MKSTNCVSALILIIIAALISACGGSGSGDDDPPPVPKIAGIWSGTWEGIESTLGPVAGTWEARISQAGADVQGPISFGGDIDCAEGRMSGTADAEQNIVSGDVTRNPCPANNWSFTAFNQDAYVASGSWKKLGLSNGSFEGKRIAKFTGPRIKHVFPTGARPGGFITIVGERLAMDPVNDSLTLGATGTILIPETVSDTVITLQLPGVLSESDHLVLKTSSGEALSPKYFNTAVATPSIGTTQNIPQGVADMLPAGITFSVNGRRAFVANRGEGSVSMVNTEIGEESVSTVIIPGPTIPIPFHAVAVDPGGRRIYVAGTNQIGVLHAHTLEMIRTLIIPASGVNQPNPQGIAVSPDGRWLLVSEAVAGGRVTVLDINNNYIVEDTQVMASGNTPRGIAVSPDNTHAYIAVSGDDNEIWSYDLTSLTVDARIVVGASPASVAVTPDANWLYVTNAPANTVNYYELATGGGGEIDFGPGIAPTALAITPDGFNVFVSSDSNSIQVIDILSKLVTQINVGGASAGVAVSPEGKRAYATVPSLNKVVEVGNQRSLRISKQGGGIGVVTTSLGGIQCGSTCMASFDKGGMVDLVATADSGSDSQFRGWSGDADCRDGLVTMNANLFCVASFEPPPPPRPSSSGGGSGSHHGSPHCFIATAAYGSWLDPHVLTLRKFRDEYLLTNSVGTWLVRYYYRHSPPIADYIRERETLRVMIRSVLAVIVYAIEYPLTAGFLLMSLVLVKVRQRVYPQKTHQFTQNAKKLAIKLLADSVSRKHLPITEYDGVKK